MVGAPSNVPLPSSLVPGWNAKGRLATETPAEKRMRLSQGIPLKTNLASEFTPPSKRGGRKRRSCVNTLPSLCLHVSCPQCYSQALKSPKVAAWKESIATELHVLQDKRRCWEIVPYLKGRHHNLLRCHFVFKVKMKDGRVDRFKSRLVVDGSKQVSCIDYTNNFAPVVKHTTVRMFLAIAAILSMCVYQLDVESAFIYAPLHEDVYMHPHPAMNIPHGHCVKLLKSLYGLKQSPRNWNTHLYKFILSIGLRLSQLDHCMYIGVIESHTALMGVFVDDILLASTCEDVTVHVKSLFQAQFRIKDIGPASKFLNIRITRRLGVISIDQEPYVNSILAKYYWYT